ncbi:reverse transcriptase domain-containing protein [Tanacetum coccineum]
MTRSFMKELFTPYKEPEREFRTSKRHFKTLSLDELRSPDFNLLSDQEYSKEEEAEAMAETMEQYMSKTRTNYRSGVPKPKIDSKDQFKLKGQFLKELRENTFSDSDNEDAIEHIEKVLEIVNLFHVPNITVDQLILRVFPISLTGAASRWLRNEPTGSIKTREDLKTKFLNKYCPPSRTAKKMEEINNFKQELDETLFQPWERFKELLMKCSQHYLTEMQEVILFYNGLDILTRQILDSRGAIPTKTGEDAKKAIKEMAEYSQKWHNGTSRGRTKTSDGLAAIQTQLNNLGREIKKVNEKVYVAQVGCEQCKGPHYTKDCPQKEEGKTLEEAYYTQFGGPFQGGGYRVTTPRYYQRNNANPSYQERRQSVEDTLSKFMSESVKRHEENSNLIKEIRAMTDAAIRNQGASIKTLEIQIGQMSKLIRTRYAVLDHPNKPYWKIRTLIVMKEWRVFIVGRTNLLREVGIKAKRFDGMITIYNGNNEVTYQMVRPHPRFKNHTNEQCNKIPPLLKVSGKDETNGISDACQKLKGFYKEVLNLGPDYIRNAKTEEWLTRGPISVHEME